MIKPQVKIEMVAMEDPTFEGGAFKTAFILLKNLAAKEFTYSLELYLGVTKAATSGVWLITIAAGATVTAVLHIYMPLVEGTYEVFVDVWHETTLLAHYKATEDVSVVITPAASVESITWE